MAISIMSTISPLNEPATNEEADLKSPPQQSAGDTNRSKFDAVTEPKAEWGGDRKCVTVIFNPTSGKTDPEARKKAISGALANHGYTCQFIATTKERGANALAKDALADGVDLVAVSGGDGTVMEVLSALVGTDMPVAVLPAGTGNLLSTNLGIPMTVPDAVEVALSGSPYRLDLVKSGDRYFAIMGGMGLDGKVIEEADRKAKDKLGVFAYFVATAKNLGRERARVQIRLDDKPVMRRRAKSVVIANMGKMTGGMEAIPTASPADGLLDIGIVTARTPGQWLRLLAYGAMGRAHDAPDLEVHQARRVSIIASKSQPVQFDGEEGGRRKEIVAEVVPGAVFVLIPRGASAARDAEEPPTEVARRSATRRLLAPAGVLLIVGVTALWFIRRNKRRTNT